MTGLSFAAPVHAEGDAGTPATTAPSGAGSGGGSGGGAASDPSASKPSSGSSSDPASGSGSGSGATVTTKKPSGGASSKDNGGSKKVDDTSTSKPTVTDLRSAKAELQRLEKEVKEVQDDFQKRMGELDHVEADLADVESRKADLEKWVDEGRQELRRLAVNTYKYGASDVSSVASIGATGDLSQVTVGIHYLKLAQVRASQSITALSGNVRALAAAQRRLSDVRAARDRLQAELDAKKERLEAAISAQTLIVEKWSNELGVVPGLGDLVNGLRKGKLVPPPEIAQYGNGQIPDGVLEYLGIGNHRLWGPAARAYRQMVWDAYSQGVYIGLTDSYRSLEAQYDVARRKGLYSQGGLAATPGTSNHGWGLATDLVLNDAALTWMRANAGRYGFVEAVPRETWHWEFRAF